MFEDRLAPLKEREYRLLFVGQSVSLLGDHVVPIAISFAILDLTGSVVDLGLVLTAQAIPLVLLLLPAGVWGDRLPRQNVMLASDLVRALAQGATAALLIAGTAKVWEIAALQAVYGAAEAFFSPASSALLPDTVTPAHLQNANALLSTVHSLADVVGPAVAAGLVVLTNPGIAIALDAGTFVVSALCLSMMKVPPPRAASAERKRFGHELAEGWHELMARTWLWVMILYVSLVTMLGIATVNVLGPYIAKHQLGGPGAWGIISAAGGLGALVGGIYALRFRPPRPMVASAILLMPTALPLVLLSVPTAVWALSVGELFWGFAIGLAVPIWDTAVQSHVPADVRSRVIAYDWLGSLALIPVGLALAGPISKVIGARAELLGAAVLVVICSLAVLLVPSVRSLRPVEAETAPA